MSAIIKRMSPDYGVEEQDAVNRVLSSGIFVKGPESKALEAEICAFTGAENCVTVNSGSTALMLSYHYLQLQSKKDKLQILTTPASYIATANVGKFLGHECVFADIDIDTYCLSPMATKSLDSNFDVVSLVHLYGNGADINKFQILYPNTPIVEDCAQAFGTTIDGKHVGTTGLGCFSMFPTKNLSCGGDGGFILCSNEAYETLVRLRDNGRYFGLEVGLASGNFRLSELQASIARAQLKKIPRQQSRRQEIALRYNEAFKELPGVIIPKVANNISHSWHLYCPLILSQSNLNRNELIDALKLASIQSSSVYPELITDTIPFKQSKTSNLYTAELFKESVISLPMHSLLTNEEVDKVINTMIELLN